MKPRRKIILYNPILKERARFLRNNSTNSEIVLWQYLKNKQLLGYDFDRQRPVDNYILDFFCYDLMLGIEIDGITHDDDIVQLKDARKESKMNQLGIVVLRFDDNDVRLNPQYYVNVIRNGLIRIKNNNTPRLVSLGTPLKRGFIATYLLLRGVPKRSEGGGMFVKLITHPSCLLNSSFREGVSAHASGKRTNLAHGFNLGPFY